MKCAHPTCHRGIGLVSHRRGWFRKQLYCSRACRDNHTAELRQPRPSRQPRSSFEPSLFEQLFVPAEARVWPCPTRPLARLRPASWRASA